MEGNEEILLWIAKLKRTSPVRYLAEATLAQPQQPLPDIQPLFAALANTRGRSWKECAVAAWTLGRTPLSPQERDAAAELLLNVLESAHREPFIRRLGRAVWRYLPLAVFLFLTDLAVENPGPVLMMLGLPIWTTFYLVFDRTHKNCIREPAARALGRLQTPESVGGLADALFDRNASVRDAAAAALHQVLPTLTDDQYGIYGAHSITALGKALNHPDPLLVFKVLEALEKVGTSAALPYVERVASNGRTVRMKDMAQGVLAVLRERREREEESKMLMRAAHPPDTASRTRLRAVYEVTEEPQTQQLLQAAEPE